MHWIINTSNPIIPWSRTISGFFLLFSLLPLWNRPKFMKKDPWISIKMYFSRVIRTIQITISLTQQFTPFIKHSVQLFHSKFHTTGKWTSSTIPPNVSHFPSLFLKHVTPSPHHKWILYTKTDTGFLCNVWNSNSRIWTRPFRNDFASSNVTCRNI